MNQFTKNTTAEEVTAHLDLSETTVLVTGCTSGIGRRACSARIARCSCLATGRNEEKVQLASRNMAGKITPLALELTDPASISDCANTLLAADVVPDTVAMRAYILSALLNW